MKGRQHPTTVTDFPPLALLLFGRKVQSVTLPGPLSHRPCAKLRTAGSLFPSWFLFRAPVLETLEISPDSLESALSLLVLVGPVRGPPTPSGSSLTGWCHHQQQHPQDFLKLLSLLMGTALFNDRYPQLPQTLQVIQLYEHKCPAEHTF